MKYKCMKGIEKIITTSYLCHKFDALTHTQKKNCNTPNKAEADLSEVTQNRQSVIFIVL